MRIYAIGDVHGHLDKLRAAHRLIEADGGADGGADAQIVHVGDLLDRGPDSRGVVDYLMQGQAAGRRWVVVKGNHDRMLPGFLRDPHYVDNGFASGREWLRHPDSGAAATLASYGVMDAELRSAEDVHAEAVAKVPVAHRRWLDALPLWHLTPVALVVHAGLRAGVGLLDQVEDDMVWIRKGFLDSDFDHGITVVHGHTPVRTPTDYGRRINIDSGAAYGGPLSAVRISAEGAWLLTEDGAAILPQGGA